MRGERGQVTVLILGFTTIVLLLVAVVSNATKAYLVRADLANTADAAALAAADAIAGRPPAGNSPPLDPTEARTLVDAYLTRFATPDLTWSIDLTDNRITVHLSTVATLPFPPGTTTITATASAIPNVR